MECADGRPGLGWGWSCIILDGAGPLGKHFGRPGRHSRREPPDQRGRGATESWAANGVACVRGERFGPGDEEPFVVLCVRDVLLHLQGIRDPLQSRREAQRDWLVSMRREGRVARGEPVLLALQS